MSNHTPGPWQRCGEDRGGCQCGHVWDATGNVHVATAEFVGMAAPDDLEAQEVYVQSLEEAKANAYLIASAPDLLAALRTCSCPRPANAVPAGVNLTVEQCIARGECGCDCGAAIRKATEPPK